MLFRSILVTGWTRSNDADFAGLNHGSGDIFIIKLDKNGDVIWKKLLGGTSSEEAYSVTTASDASILITGRTYSNTGTFEDMARGSDDGFVMKLDKNGEVLWTRILGGTLRDWCYSIAVTSDDNVIVSGWTTSKDGDFKGLNKGEWDIFIMKLDSDGRVVWKNTIGGTRSDVSSSVTTTSDGGILNAGSTESNDGDFKELNKGSADITVIKLDMYGEVIWKKLLGGTRQEGNTSITTTSEDDVLITGFTNSRDEDFKGRNSYNGEVFIIKLDGNGKVKHTKWYGGTFGDEGSSISSTPNGNILVTGWFNSNDGIFTDMNRGDKDIFIMQLDSNGNFAPSTSVDEHTSTSSPLIVPPNPLSTASTITYSLQAPSLVRIELMNTMGRVVDVVFDGYRESGTQRLALNISTLTSGMYSVRMIAEAGVWTAQARSVRLSTTVRGVFRLYAAQTKRPPENTSFPRV